MRVGWIGTGLMGLPMARRVLDAGHDLAVYSRTMEKARPLVDAGATACASVADTVGGRDVVVTMLSMPGDVEDVYLGPDGVLGGAEPGSVAVDCTTSSPALAARIAAAGAERGVQMVDAPVSGGPFGAEQGTLSVMAGGSPDAVAAARPVLDAFGSTVVHHGPAGTGQLAKLVNQVLVAGVTLASCEAYALAAASGLDPEQALRSIRPGVAGSPLLDFVWSRVGAGDLSPGFKLSHLLKDLALALDEADADAVPLAGTRLVRELAERVATDLGPDVGTQALVTAATAPESPK